MKDTDEKPTNPKLVSEEEEEYLSEAIRSSTTL